MHECKISEKLVELRVQKGITQDNLAKSLSVSNKTISKWETGRALPDSSIMLTLCQILKISVNDLLSGEVVTISDYNKELEKNLLEMVRQKEESDKRLFTFEWVIGILSMIILFVPIIIAAYLPMQDWQRVVLMFSGFIPCFVGFFFALKIEQVAGYYECKHCKHRYVPTYKALNRSMHMGRTRYMRCPQCGKASWHKKVLTKE